MEKYTCLNLVIHKGSTKRNGLVAEVLKGINNVYKLLLGHLCLLAIFSVRCYPSLQMTGGKLTMK